MSSTDTTTTTETQPTLPTGAGCWVEVPALDVKRAKQFYTTVFNWTFSPNPPPPTHYTDDTIAMFTMPGCGENKMRGGIVRKEGAAGLHAAKMVYLWAEDLKEVSENVKTAGGKLVGESYKEGEFGLIQDFEDSEGNLGGMYMALKK